MTDEELKAAVAAFMAKHGGSGDAAVMTLLREGRQYRQKLKTLKDENAQLRAKVPADGSTVLSADDAKALEAYRALGKVEDVKTKLASAADLQKELDGVARQRRWDEAAGAHGLKADPLKQLAGEALDVEVTQITENGQARKVAFVKDGADRKPLDQYVTEKWGSFLPALKADAAGGGGKPNAPQYPKEPGDGAPHPSQSGGRAPQQSKLVADLMARNRAAAEAVNPLKPAAPAKTGA